MLGELDAGKIEALCHRLRVPNEYRELALLAVKLAALLPPGDAAWALSLYEAADAFRRPERFAQWLQLLAARQSAAGASREAIESLTGRLHSGLRTAGSVRLDAQVLQQLAGPEIAARLRQERLAALSRA
jgi:tRNA nucleotidyltransferase (CCA-adding enzyme)